jgi:transcriptional regulator with XRE-family HTH domain
MEAKEQKNEREAVGQKLKAIRNFKKLKQEDIAKQLGYTSINFISLVEKGSSNIPFNKILDFAEAYEVDSCEFSKFIIKNIYPDYEKFFINFCTRIIEKFIENGIKPTMANVEKELNTNLLNSFGN